MNYCRYCEKKLVAKKRKNGKLESDAQVNNRFYCGLICHNADKKQKTAMKKEAVKAMDSFLYTAWRI